MKKKRGTSATWHYFLVFTIFPVLLQAGGAWVSWKDKSRRACTLTGLGLVVFLMYILWVRITSDHPLLRAVEETRLRYSLSLPLADLITYSRWRYKQTLPLSTLLSLVFICINILKPRVHNRTLMPALQNPQLIPHVIVYALAHALLGAMFVMSVYLLVIKRQKASLNEVDICDSLTYTDWVSLITGMLSGTLQAKEARGHYWVWSPKETWVVATWLAYLAYIHLRLGGKGSLGTALWILAINFVLLQMYWWGINFLLSVQGASVYTYSVN